MVYILWSPDDPSCCHLLTKLQEVSNNSGLFPRPVQTLKSVTHTNYLSLTHLLEGQDLMMAIEYSGTFSELAAYSCFYLTCDIFTQSAQCHSLYVNVVLAVVWCWTYSQQ